VVEEQGRLFGQPSLAFQSFNNRACVALDSVQVPQLQLIGAEDALFIGNPWNWVVGSLEWVISFLLERPRVDASRLGAGPCFSAVALPGLDSSWLV
jgi:hypothetical protein